MKSPSSSLTGRCNRMARVLYFARVAELMGLKSEDIDTTGCDTVADLIQLLRARGEPYQHALDTETRILIAVNQEMCPAETPISNTDEIAFFPPVTGG